MDTTTLYFEGRGGDLLGQRGHSKDYRPHLNQMVVGIIMDQNGRPVCSEMWPGNTADVTTLLPVIDRLRVSSLNKSRRRANSCSSTRSLMQRGASVRAVCSVSGNS